jgi:predicted MFS family arabinose efflux permease
MEVAPRARGRPNGSPWRDLVDGFRFVARTGPVRALLLLLGLASLTAIPYVVLMPIFADQILGSGPRGLGILMAASGVGAVAGALSLAARRKRDGLSVGVAVAAAGFGTVLLLFALSRSFWVSAAFLAPAGFFMVRQLVSSNTLIQAMVPDALRGRVMAIYSMTLMGLAPFGALSAGLLAHHFGAPTAVLFGGVSCLAGAAVFWARLPHFRPEARRLIRAQEEAGRAPQEDAR